MDKFMGFMDKYVVPMAAKIGAQRHLVAIRDAFVSMIALAMVGSLATLVNNLPWKAYQNFMANVFGEGWTTLGGDIWWGTLALMSLFVVFGVAYNLAVSYKEDGLQAGLIATSIFFILAPQVASFKTEVGEVVSGWGFIPSAYVGTGALFTAIIVGLLATECFVKLSKIKQLTIKLPAGVPPAVSRSFAKLIPGMITIILFAVIGLGLKFGTGQYLTDLINTYVGTPLRNVADSLPSAIFIVLIVQCLWFVGLHGSNIALPFTQTLLMDLGAQNAALAQAGADPSKFKVLAGPFFDAFVYLGGAGACLGLIVAIIIAGKRRKDMVALGGLPACFNINEPIIFGMPLVLNPIYAIPFILTPVLLTTISYLSISWGVVSPVIVATIPWTTPPIIGGFLATGSISGAVLAAVNLVVSVVIYLPFVIAAERIDAKREREAANK